MKLQHRNMINMKTLLSILIFISSTSAIQKKDPPFSIILEASDSALALLMSIIDLFKSSTEQHEIERLTKQISYLKNNLNIDLNFLFATTLNKSLYENAIAGYINKIESCKADYLNYVDNLSDASMENLVKCSDIMGSVRPLGKYLSGARIVDGPLLFDIFKNKEGVCNGSAIESVYKALFAEYVIGCSVATTIEELENGANTRLYANECNDIMSTVVDYVKRSYSECAPPSCKAFHSSVQRIFHNNQISSPKDLFEKLTDAYPWFHFIIFEFSKGGKATASGNFSIGHDDGHWKNEHQYDIFFFDANLEITMEKNIYSFTIQVHEKFYIGHYFGNSTMNMSFQSGLFFRAFRGFATENNEFCTNYRPSGKTPYRVMLTGGSESSNGRNISASNMLLYIVVSIVYCTHQLLQRTIEYEYP